MRRLIPRPSAPPMPCPATPSPNSVPISLTVCPVDGMGALGVKNGRVIFESTRPPAAPSPAPTADETGPNGAPTTAPAVPSPTGAAISIPCCTPRPIPGHTLCCWRMSAKSCSTLFPVGPTAAGADGTPLLWRIWARSSSTVAAIRAPCARGTLCEAPCLSDPAREVDCTRQG